MKQTQLKRGTKELRKTKIKYQSGKQKVMQHNFRKLCYYLIQNRANEQCEIRGENCINQNLWGHHIIKRSKLRDDSARNIIIGCNRCHDHTTYPDYGIPITPENAQQIVDKANKKYNISPFLIGEEL